MDQQGHFEGTQCFPHICKHFHWAHGVVVSHPLSMREALGLIPSVSISCFFLASSSSLHPCLFREGTNSRKTEGFRQSTSMHQHLCYKHKLRKHKRTPDPISEKETSKPFLARKRSPEILLCPCVFVFLCAQEKQTRENPCICSIFLLQNSLIRQRCEHAMASLAQLVRA